MVPFYSTLARFVDKLGIIQSPWIQYLQQFTTAPPPFAEVIVGSSPFTYEAKEPGNLFINGGAVSAIILTRGADTITVTGDLIPVAVNDTVTVTWSVKPTIKFIASYGQNTNT